MPAPPPESLPAIVSAVFIRYYALLCSLPCLRRSPRAPIRALRIGARLGMASQLLYLALGIAGLPVFAASPSLPHGVARLVGPTGGYLMAYPLAAFVAGWLAERGFDRRYVTAFIAMACGLAIVFAGGVLWLAWLGQRPRGLNAALAAGFYPFIVADLLKLLAAAAVMPAAWRLARSRAR